ncbi:rhodanese-like domain-containing protein [Oceaniglobus roseus]|uniref:rhodanese-like domain-containing protein n=1 Tax=Oceaniglobus roseus TaxID=1737570 RepID=UPI0012FFF038|nr:rhodanese-like domain-containing protein [Kandeliimicrobium roseum]
MAMTASQMIDAARQNVQVIEPADVGDKFILDVREPTELTEKGRIPGALNIPRGLLEWQADPSSDGGAADLKAQAGKGTVCVLCAAGGRAVLAAETLKKMGYDAVYIRGGLGGWKEAGLPTE